MNGYRAGLAGLLPPLAVEFFVAIARFDFALKRGGFLAGETDKKASADWDGFASFLGPAFFNRMKEEPPARIFFEAPPKRLVVTSDGGSEFRDAEPIANAQTLLLAVRLVRNNLFHGEKPGVNVRDEKLMTAALFILDSAFQVA